MQNRDNTKKWLGRESVDLTANKVKLMSISFHKPKQFKLTEILIDCGRP